MHHTTESDALKICTTNFRANNKASPINREAKFQKRNISYASGVKQVFFFKTLLYINNGRAN